MSVVRRRSFEVANSYANTIAGFHWQMYRIGRKGSADPLAQFPENRFASGRSGARR